MWWFTSPCFRHQPLILVKVEGLKFHLKLNLLPNNGWISNKISTICSSTEGHCSPPPTHSHVHVSLHSTSTTMILSHVVPVIVHLLGTMGWEEHTASPPAAETCLVLWSSSPCQQEQWERERKLVYPQVNAHQVLWAEWIAREQCCTRTETNESNGNAYRTFFPANCTCVSNVLRILLYCWELF